MSKAGRGILIEASKRTKPWRAIVLQAAMEVHAEKLIGPVTLDIDFTLPKPKSAPKRKRIWPDRKPDCSKLVRAVEDSLTDAGIWEDDSRVVSLIARKLYVGDRDAMSVPGAVIRVDRVAE